MDSRHRARLTALLDSLLDRPLFQVITQRLGPDRVYCVGGCVRDAVLDRPLGDVDLATPLDPDAIHAALSDTDITIIPTGLDHGTLTLTHGGDYTEITSFRGDVATDGRRAVVAFTDSLDADSLRRDLTMNALYLSLSGQFFDPQDGLADAVSGTLRFIGDARSRLREDYLRILRYFRFYAGYGKGDTDAETLAVIAQERGGLSQLSAERIGAEVMKLLALPSPLVAVRRMLNADICLGGILTPGGVDRLAHLETRAADLASDITPALGSVDRLAALLLGGRGTVQIAGDHLRLSGQQTRQLANRISAATDDVSDLSPPSALRRLAYRWGSDAARFAALAAEDIAVTSAMITELQRWAVPVLPVRGVDLLAAGVQPGPQMGAMLKAAEAAFIASDFTADRASLLAAIGVHA